MRIILSILAICTVSTFLNACNTMEGMGKDISKGGDAIADTAQDAKN